MTAAAVDIVDERRLASGVRLLCEPLPGYRSVAVGIFVGVGSRDERDTEAGLCHFLEHLVFKGTERRSARQLAEQIDAVGGQLNAYTTREYTCFYTKVLGEHVDLAIDLLADMVVHPRLDPADVERERQVILEELSMVEDAPEELVQDLFYGALWPDHPMGRPVAGDIASVTRLSCAEIAAFHRRHYTGPNMVVALAGQVDPARAAAAWSSRLADLPAVSTRTVQPAPVAHPGRLRRTKRTEQVQVSFGTAAPGLRSDEAWPALLLASVFGGGGSSRLFQTIREERGLCYEIEAFHQAESDCGAFGVGLAAGPSTVGRAVRLARREWRRLQRHSVPADELRRHKDQFRAGVWLGLEGTSGRMARLGRMAVLACPLLAPEAMIERVEAVRADDLRQLALRLGDPEDWAAAAVGPGRSLARSWNWNEAAAFRP